MKKLVIFIGVVLVAYLGYRVVFADSPAVTTYKAFADAVVRGRFDIAEQHSTGLVVPMLEAKGRGKSDYVLLGAQTMGRGNYAIESETKSGNQVVIQATQAVGFTPPGVESAMAVMSALFHHTTTLEKIDGSWKVVDFDSSFVKTVELRG